MQTEEKKYISPEEYLAIERQAEFKSEYYNGDIFALVGGSFKHNQIAHNISAKLEYLLKDKNCNTLQSDMKVFIEETNLYTYPDVLVVCGEPKFQDEREDALLNPVVIFEILSPSTESYDRAQKFVFYKKLSSLKDYILVAQDKILVEHFTRIASNEWNLKEYTSAEENFNINSVGCFLQLTDIYNKIDFNKK